MTIWSTSAPFHTPIRPYPLLSGTSLMMTRSAVYAHVTRYLYTWISPTRWVSCSRSISGVYTKISNDARLSACPLRLMTFF